ncbi:MAG: exodeoxyribonuclease VII small subunit [Gammaproteobacteria bacterium]|nr:exodeoxyribonuclease VII small subunit [Gammaproteobacteria bacterium]
MAKKQHDKPDFESALKELEQLVDTLENGDLTLEQSLAHFERGVELTRICQTALDAAQQKVDMLMDADAHGGGELVDFGDSDAGDGQ